MRALRHEGLARTSVKVLRYPLGRLRHRQFEKRVLSLESAEDRFTWIYRNNHWTSRESASGAGSTLKYTENLRRELPRLWADLSIRSVFDAPCGDFNWMRHLLQDHDIRYVGGDIVRPLIDSHIARYKTDRIDFVQLDLIRDPFPEADLMICRDCLFHLSFDDTRSVLRNFLASGIPFLLTTTHRNDGFENRDIKTGDFRLIDLFAPPYSFPTDPLARIDDWLAPDPERQMCLWNREQIACAMG